MSFAAMVALGSLTIGLLLIPGLWWSGFFHWMASRSEADRGKANQDRAECVVKEFSP